MISNTPKISIGMPVYNGNPSIECAIEALLSQTFKDFELIISDNSSIDDTHLICEKFIRRDDRIRYIRQNINIGAVENFKFVLHAARGKFFMWAAHDDIWSKDYLDDAMQLLKDSNLSFVFPKYELKSIFFNYSKKISPEIFKFVEEPDKKTRIIKFMLLHYRAHSANIVYSVFRTEFIKTVLDIHDISSDGLFGLVVLSLGRGKVSNALFTKRYSVMYPGALPGIIDIAICWLHGVNYMEEAKKSIQKARNKVLSLFPEYKIEIEYIYNNYHPYKHDLNYQICKLKH